MRRTDGRTDGLGATLCATSIGMAA